MVRALTEYNNQLLEVAASNFFMLAYKCIRVCLLLVETLISNFFIIQVVVG